MTQVRLENARFALDEMENLHRNNYNESNFGLIDIRKQLINSNDKMENGKYFVYVNTYTSAYDLFKSIKKMIKQLENKKNIELQVYDFSQEQEYKSYSIEFIKRTSKYNLYFSYTLDIKNK